MLAHGEHDSFRSMVALVKQISCTLGNPFSFRHSDVFSHVCGFPP
jgi:hypothetical protein